MPTLIIYLAAWLLGKVETMNQTPTQGNRKCWWQKEDCQCVKSVVRIARGLIYEHCICKRISLKKACAPPPTKGGSFQRWSWQEKVHTGTVWPMLMNIWRQRNTPQCNIEYITLQLLIIQYFIINITVPVTHNSIYHHLILYEVSVHFISVRKTIAVTVVLITGPSSLMDFDL